MAKKQKNAKMDFAKIRQGMRKQLASEMTKINFNDTKPKNKWAATSRNKGVKKDFAKIRDNMKKTEKQLERTNKTIKPKRDKPLKKEKHIKKAKQTADKKIMLKVSKQEIKDVQKIQNVQSAPLTVSISRKHTVTKAEVQFVMRKLDDMRKEIGKVVVGQDQVINDLLIAILCDGHVLVEGVPGIAKTLIVKTLATITGGNSQRIQFTADLLPTDILGVSSYSKSAGFNVIKGPIFTNFVLADEINRASPKVQAALLEAMQEREVTIFKESYQLPRPFFVMATQNPLESLGVYPLPQAQIDRFLFKILMDYPSSLDEQKILLNNITINDFKSYRLQSVVSQNEIIRMQDIVKRIYLNERMERYIVNIIDKTRNPGQDGLGRFIQYGASPRGSIGIYIAAKAAALLDGSDYVRPNHIKRIAHQVLRHRIILTYEGQAEDIDTDDFIDQVLSKVSVP